MMEIPGIRYVTASESHMYVLSDREGLVVFRTSADSLQWLYSSSGLSGRGDRMVADIRFSYLFGTDGRLTVIEPTSVLGVYSSTRLSFDPNDLVRLGDDLFLADSSLGIQKLSLATSESVDREPESAHEHNRPVVSLARISNRLLALDSDNRLLVFENRDGTLALSDEFELSGSGGRLHTIGSRLYLTTEGGAVYRVRLDGRADLLFETGEPITHLKLWNGNYLIRGESSRIRIARQGLRPTLFRDDPSAGNHIATFKQQLWISEYRELSRWLDSGDFAELDTAGTGAPDGQPSGSATAGEPPRLAEIGDLVIPYPRPLLMTLELESDHSPEEVRFQQRSNIDRIRIRGNGLYWQPSSSDVGTHIISLIASTQDGLTDSTSFQVTIRPFNSPPRFSPLRTLSIAVDEEFTIPIRASDPDGSDPDLIRYIGVDLPDGASLDERSGDFTWTPTRRQTGEHEFQVIATDQYGAASSTDVRITVVDLARGES
ncbi:putative Ig domain-containing protein [Balneolales bacterium ANBcel1]|nr:putative Ig domain-containing protein [Balneolales bacterium ANBcel1]